MSERLDISWVVYRSIENADHDRCVDFFQRVNGSFGFEEFRRDVEDAGTWTPVQYYSHASFESEETALKAACEAVRWLSESIKPVSRRRKASDSDDV